MSHGGWQAAQDRFGPPSGTDLRAFSTGGTTMDPGVRTGGSARVADGATSTAQGPLGRCGGEGLGTGTAGHRGAMPMTVRPSSVALYARVSSEQQARVSTIASQVEALRQRIHDDGLKLEEELCFVDDGYSGSTLVRPPLERLRDQAAAGTIH